MEPSYQTRKIIGRILALCCALLLAGAFWVQHTSPLLTAVVTRQNTPVRLLVLTQPAMRVAYNPADRKALITLDHAACATRDPSTCFNGEFDFFYRPAQPERQAFWTLFKDNLSMWRYQPLAIAHYVKAYVNAWVQKRTDINPGIFLVLSKELPALTPADFAVQYSKNTAKKKGKKASPETPAPAAVQPELSHAVKKPLKVIVLNASGKRGLAESLKQYLRSQYAKGLLQVDVYDTGNYPTEQDQSFLIDYSGNLVAVTQLSHAIGINGEIRSEKPTGDIYDTTIVLGKDFEMPL